jgi:hypothetical protein
MAKQHGLKIWLNEDFFSHCQSEPEVYYFLIVSSVIALLPMNAAALAMCGPRGLEHWRAVLRAGCSRRVIGTFGSFC